MGCYGFANALAAQHREDEAFEVLQRAIRTDPWHPSIAVNMAADLANRGDSDAAIAMLEQQIDRPNAPYALYGGLRNLYLQSGRIAALHELGQAQSLAVAAEPHFVLAFGYASLGLWPQATYWLERSMRELPDRWPVPFYEALVPMWQGNYAVAAEQFEAVMVQRGFMLAQHDQAYSEWLGTLLAYAGRHAEAIEVLGPLYVDPPRIRLQVAFEPLYAPHALAWSSRGIGDDARATTLLAAIEERCRTRTALGMLHHTELIFVCAQNALLRGEIELALLRLEQAVARGWRGYHLVIEQPFWQSLRGNSRFDGLMTQVQTDLDRHRAEVQRRDAEVDFIAKLDAAIAARQRRVADPTPAAATSVVRSSVRGSRR